MTSPVDIPFRSFITIDRTSSTPIYLQIGKQLIQAIQRAQLPANTKLLGTRQLAELLEVHRNTIVSTYDELAAQGWIEIKPNRGTFVAADIPALKTKVSATTGYPTRTGFSFQKSNLLDNPYEAIIPCAYIFNDGSPDIRLTQVDDISQFYSANIKRKSNLKKMGYYSRDGSEYFKEQLARYLQVSRGLAISTNNLLITRSVEMSLFIISEILLQPDDIVVVGTPSYFSANMSFQKVGANIRTIPVEEDGICIKSLREICQHETIRMVYVTPHHHYPTTVSLSPTKRMALLRLAQEYGFVIVEDDHDYDFHYDKQPLLPLATADSAGMVIYVGSFGKSLAPGFRTGFIVAPENLMQEMRKYLGIIDRQGDVLMEQALGEMIADGAIHRHLKKSIRIYKERRDSMATMLVAALGDWISFDIPSGGLAFWVEFRKPINLLKLRNGCAEKGLFIPRTLLYQTKEVTAMRVGFGHLSDEEMESSVAILKEVIKNS